MTTTQMSSEQVTQKPTPATVDLKLEAVVIPVSDVDRAKRFYESLGWRLDADFPGLGNWRGVQFTPPGSPCSIQFGNGVTTAAPGSIKNLYLVVSDIEAARAELIGRGVEVSEAFHFVAFGGAPVPGPDPTGKSYATFATFSDPDGNSWLLQEIKTRLPGRGLSNLDLATLTELLRDAEQRHGAYKRPPRSTTGRTFTPPTSSRASTGRRPRRRSRLPCSTWSVRVDKEDKCDSWSTITGHAARPMVFIRVRPQPPAAGLETKAPLGDPDQRPPPQTPSLRSSPIADLRLVAAPR